MAAVGSPRWSARGPRPRARRGDVDGVAAPKEETQEGIGKKRRGSSWRRRLRRDGARRKTSISILSHLGIALFFLTHLVALLMIPLGLPGTFLQVGAALVMTVASGGARMGWGWVGLFFGLALVGELIEFLCGQWGTRRFGGSRQAGWGALIGGGLGAVVGGVPIPVIGSILMSFLGTFIGALLGELYRQRTAAPTLRVGLGAVIGRTVGAGTKLFLGVVMLLISVGVILGRH